MYIGSFSKILGPGVRLGFFIAPEPISSRLMAWKMDGGTSMLSQLVAAEYFMDHLWEHIEEGRQAVKDKRNTLLDALESEFGNVPGMSWTRPEGGLFLWIKLPPEVDRARLQQLATAAGIVYSTGQAFNTTNEQEIGFRESMKIGNYELVCQKYTQDDLPNYGTELAIIDVYKNGKFLQTFYPERRFYKASQQPQSMVAIRQPEVPVIISVATGVTCPSNDFAKSRVGGRLRISDGVATPGMAASWSDTVSKSACRRLSTV